MFDSIQNEQYLGSFIMQEHKSCSVFGTNNIEITGELKEKIKSAFLTLLERGYKIFYFGGFGKFDYTCYQIISSLKDGVEGVKRVFCVADSGWLKPSKRPKWLNEENYEEIIYFKLENDWWYKRIYFRNCEIINHSDFILFYALEDKDSGAYKALKYAKKIKKRFVNLSDDNAI